MHNTNKKTKAFDTFAHTYGEYNIIQKKIIKRCLPLLKNRVVDLGCGSEGLCRYKRFDFYLGIDSSEEMLKRNPCSVVKADFNTPHCFELIKRHDFEQVVSFSALQWAKDLYFVFSRIKKLSKSSLLAIFTSGTFKTLHKSLGITSPIYSESEILKHSKVLNPKNIEKIRYKMTFTNPKEMLEYIKFSGVSGGVKTPPVKIRKFIREFPINFLEFEILIIEA